MLALILTFLASVLPAALLLALGWLFILSEREHEGVTFLPFLWGMFGAAFLAMVLQAAAVSALREVTGGEAGEAIVALTLGPLVEEVLKALPLLVLFIRVPGAPAALLLYVGLCSGAGFAAAEMFVSLYEVDLYGEPDEYLRRWLLRALYFLPMHTALPMLIALLLAPAKRPYRLLLLPLAVLVATVLHSLANAMSLAFFSGGFAFEPKMLLLLPMGLLLTLFLIGRYLRSGFSFGKEG